MTDGDLPLAIRQFINNHIKSVAALEALFLMRSMPHKEWTEEELSQEMRSNPSYAATLLSELETANLVIVQQNQNYKTYMFSTTNDDVVMELERLYAQKRLSVINQIYAQPMEKIKTFADAFKVRKE